MLFTDVYNHTLSHPEMEKSPLRILVVLSDPEGVEPLNLDQEARVILDGLRGQVDFIEEGTLQNLHMMLMENDYHVLHYTGHGGGSFLMMENEEGGIHRVYVDDILPLLCDVKSLRLIVLNGCQTASFTGLLQAAPAVVAMRDDIKDISAHYFASAFYEAIGRGETLETAVQAGQLAIKTNSPFPADWKIPTLYTRCPDMRLINPAESVKPHAESAEPYIFTGRRQEQRQLRRLLLNPEIPVVYIWGLKGIGKSALVSRILKRSGHKAALIIDCQKTEPPEILAKLAAWLQPVFPEATTILTNHDLLPHQRIERAANFVQSCRLTLVLDGFASYDDPLFQALATASWSIQTIFTSRYRWHFLSRLHCFEEIHLGMLDSYDLKFLLCHENLPVPKLIELDRTIGGHPAALHLVADKLASGSQLDESFFKKLATEFLADVINQMTGLEHSTLVQMCILESPFRAAQVQRMADIPTHEEAERLLMRWEMLSLAEFQSIDDEGERWVEIPPLVRYVLRHQLLPDQKKKLHKRASAVILHDLTAGKEDFRMARLEVRKALHHTPDKYRVQHIRYAVAWWNHYLQAGDYQQAAAIANDIWREVRRTPYEGENATTMLLQTIKTVNGKEWVIALINLFTLAYLTLTLRYPLAYLKRSGEIKMSNETVQSYRPLNELIPAHWQHGTVQAADGTTIHYTRTGGDKPALVLLHGVQVNGLTWLRTANVLEAEYDIVMPDARGHGQTSLENGVSNTILVDDVIAVIKALGLENPFVIGHSMGADVAGRLAAVYPLRGVVLVDPALVKFGIPMPADGSMPDYMKPVMEAMQSLKHQSHEERMITGQRLMMPGSPAMVEADYVPFIDSAAQFDFTFYQHMSNLGSPLFEDAEVIARIDSPILLLTARSMMPGTPPGLAAFKDNWRDGEHVHFPNSGHFIQGEAFEEFIDVVKQFFDKY